MLRIRREQWEILTQASQHEFIVRACEHIRLCWPEKAAGYERADLEKYVIRMVTNARKYGVASQRDLIRYIDIACLLGDNFDTSKKRSWVPEILNREEDPIDQRLFEIWSQCRIYIEKSMLE